MSTPLFIPYVNRPDLLWLALGSVPWSMNVVPVILNNSGQSLNAPCEVLTPPVPLTFTQTQNWMLKIAADRGVPFYFFLHSDAEAGDGVIQKLYEMAKAQKEKWGVIFTAYDALAAFNTEAFTAIGGWDTMLSWYCADNDCYHRLRLAGYPTLESNLPVKHEPSQTLKADSVVRRNVDLEIPFRQSYYYAKWGGDPGEERFTHPFGMPVTQSKSS